MSNIHLELKHENRNRVFRKILESGSISASALSYELQLSRPTIKQNLDELTQLGYVYESGSQGHTGGRSARVYSVVAESRIAVGVDLTRNHITVVLVDFRGELVCEKRTRCSFSRSDEYFRTLGKLVTDTVRSMGIPDTAIIGVGIVVPGLITEDHMRVFYGTILGFTGMTADEIGKYIPYPCRLYNDADAGGYAEISKRAELADAFYISLSNNIGGAILIGHNVYKGEGPRSGEIGHMTIVPDGRACYCGQMGCFETYCNATLLSGRYDGNLDEFFENLKKEEPGCVELWAEYMEYLSIAVNNIRMLFDCKVILGGYVGAYMTEYLDALKEEAMRRNPFEDNADYLLSCIVKKEALALGGALPFIHEFWKDV